VNHATRSDVSVIAAYCIPTKSIKKEKAIPKRTPNPRTLLVSINALV
jgi:hypothetical protein